MMHFERGRALIVALVLLDLLGPLVVKLTPVNNLLPLVDWPLGESLPSLGQPVRLEKPVPRLGMTVVAANNS